MIKRLLLMLALLLCVSLLLPNHESPPEEDAYPEYEGNPTPEQLDVVRSMIGFRLYHPEVIEEDARILLVIEDFNSNSASFLAFDSVNSSGILRGKMYVLTPTFLTLYVVWDDCAHEIKFRVRKNDSRNYVLDIDFAADEVTLTKLEQEVFTEFDPVTNCVIL